ncbi:MAG: WbqC family protein [Caulobacteraceae bacterium]
MIVAIHQPMFFPYTGIIEKIKRCDVFVFLDDVQYEDGGFQNRNRILTKDGVKWFTVPIKRPRYMRNLQEIMLSNYNDWKGYFLSTLQYTYGKAKYYREVIDLVNEILNKEYSRLIDLNIECMMQILKYFGINRETHRSSDFPDKPTDRIDRIIYLVRQLGGDTFLSGDGAKVYMDVERFQDIKVVFQEYKCKEYPQMWSKEFVPYMSILDYMMYMGRDVSRL